MAREPWNKRTVGGITWTYCGKPEYGYILWESRVGSLKRAVNSGQWYFNGVQTGHYQLKDAMALVAVKKS